jgi:hypothetical protein
MKATKQKRTTVHSDFWFDRTSKNIQDTDIQKLLAMSEIQRAIGNFVQIVSNKRVPVLFAGKQSYTDNESVVIASVKDKNFDSTCGLALHEASHIKYSLSPKDTFKNIENYITHKMPNGPGGSSFNTYGTAIGDYQHQSNLKDLQNWIEDRRIDALVKQASPGYIGYYEAMYNFYFRSNDINVAIASSKYRKADNLDHYFMRIINFLSPATDLDALPGLRLVWNKIDLKNISRLTSTYDGFVLATEVYDIILSYYSKAVKLRKEPKPKPQPKMKSEKQENTKSSDKKDEAEKESGKSDEDKDGESEDLIDENDIDDTKDSHSDGSEDEDDEPAQTSHNGEDKPEDDEDDDNESNNKTSKANEDESDSTEKPSDEDIEDEIQKALDSEDEDKEPLTDRAQRKAENALQGQKNFLNGEVEKERVTEKDNTQLEMLEKMKAKFIPVDVRDVNGNLIKIDVLSIEHIPDKLFDYDMTLEKSQIQQILEKIGVNTIFENIFKVKSYDHSTTAKLMKDSSGYKVIESGIRLGKLLGSKLKIRTEERILKTTRQSGGKIDRRIVHLAAAGIENLFCSLRTDQFNKAHLHISIDASGSMNNGKFDKALQTAAAICSAADAVKNIDVVVTVRTTTEAKTTKIVTSRSSGHQREKVISKSVWPTVAVIYNSKKDKLNKILKVWPWLSARGMTPEAITYEAERELMPKGSLGSDVYFITLTDGAPGDSGEGKDERIGPISWHYGVGYANRVNSFSNGSIDAAVHTKFQISQMNKDGIATMAFFISDMEQEKIAAFNSAPPEDIEELSKYERSVAKDKLIEKYGNCYELIAFKKCYGKDGVAIDSTNLIQLAKVMNNLFLKGNPFGS